MTATTVSWVEQAACRGRPLSWWFPVRGDNFTGQVAKMICRSCPVKRECLADALAHDDDPGAGIFGGLTPAERAAL